MIFRHQDQQFDLSRRTLIIGIVNVTPDSFSDGGKFLNRDAAVAHGLELVRQGADVLDIGGESTRPGAEPVPIDEEIRRVVPVIEGIRRESTVAISVDTYKAGVAAAAIEAGASIVNDISGFQLDAEIPEVVRRTGAGAILMHMQGTPRTMQKNPQYADVVHEVKNHLRERIEFALARRIDRERIMIDPGIGFGKTMEHNLQLLRGLPSFRSLDRPILVGTSRKAFITRTVGENMESRDWGTAATVVYCITQGAHAVRVHNTHLCQQVARMTDAVVYGISK